MNRFLDTKVSCFNIELKKHFFDFLEIQPLNTYSKVNPLSGAAMYKILLDFTYGYDYELIIQVLTDCVLDIHNLDYKDANPFWILPLQKILENETNKFHSLDELSKRMDLHPVYMTKCFKSKKGYTIREYQLKTKLSRGAVMLTRDKTTISSVAFELGFYDNAHFTRSFKKYFGISPHQFRNQLMVN
ncbi:helix-turn-helix domain-containing protein [Flagellimonas flava]|nr:AraC family transcriptional regulator [Allomuricauda flava]